jgi:methylaspartate mutase sigma subunit
VEHALRSAGATVISLGVQVPQKEIVDAVRETAADAVFLSSSNGHAAMSSGGLKDALAEAGVSNVLLYIGGHLVVGRSDDFEAIESTFRELGFDRVYSPRTDPQRAVEDLAADVRQRNVAS